MPAPPQPTLLELLGNLPYFQYYTGVGNFNQDRLPFGDDLPGGGDSGEPYIKVPIPTEFPSNTDATSIVTITEHAATDVKRITDFFTKSVKGPIFLATQVGLQLMNVQPEIRTKNNNKPTSGQGLVTDLSNVVTNFTNGIANEIGVTRVFNPVGSNILAEVAGVGFGEHFVRHGFTPFMDDQDKHQAVVEYNEKNGADRLQLLTQQLSDPSRANEPIVDYIGGPNTLLGIGRTTIYPIPSGDVFNNSDNTTEKRVTLLKGFIPIKVQNLINIDDTGKIQLEVGGDGAVVNGQEFDFNTQDYRSFKNMIRQTDQTELPETDYPTLNMNTRIGTARARNSYEYTPDYWVNVPSAADKINMLSLFYSDIPFKGTDVNGTVVTPKGVRDLIKFRLKAIDNDNPGFGVYMVFRAFLNGEINRKTDSKWDPYTYIGRGESFYLYNGFTTIMSVEFTICAFSREEMKPLYQKLNYLMSTMAPDYKNNKMRGNLIELTIGDFLKYQPGIITSLNVDIPEDANWEIALGQDMSGSIYTDMHELPMMIKCSMNFIPIYNFLPQKSSEAPFIGIDKKTGAENDWTTGTSLQLTKPIDNTNS